VIATLPRLSTPRQAKNTALLRARLPPPPSLPPPLPPSRRCPTPPPIPPTQSLPPSLPPSLPRKSMPPMCQDGPWRLGKEGGREGGRKGGKKRERKKSDMIARRSFSFSSRAKARVMNEAKGSEQARNKLRGRHSMLTLNFFPLPTRQQCTYPLSLLPSLPPSLPACLSLPPSLQDGRRSDRAGSVEGGPFPSPSSPAPRARPGANVLLTTRCPPRPRTAMAALHA